MIKIDVSKSVVYDDIDTKFDGLELGQIGYFSNEPSFENYTIGQLSDINTTVPFRYKTSSYDRFTYFIPEDKAVLKKESNQYRPFLYMSELPFKAGDTVTIRVKDAPDTIYAVVNAIVCNGDKIACISFGTTLSMFSPIHYFNGYELLMNDEWMPFGIKE